MKKRTILSFVIAIGGTVGAVYALKNQSILLLISIFVLSFLIAYKLTNYIADFRTVKNNSRIDIVFLLIFFILLCLPISHIDKSVKSDTENRNLAKKPALVSKHKLNYNFGKDFNNWFNDRFNARKQAINTNIAITCMINSKNCKNGEVTFDKKHNLLYREFNFWGMKPITKNKEDILKTHAINIGKLQEYCNNNNIGLYLLIVPRACDYFDFDMPDKRKYTTNPADEVIDYIKANTNVKIVYPKKEMEEANKVSPVFFKTDHHWTKKGAYTGYSSLIKEIKKEYPDVDLLDENKLEKYYDKRVSEWWNKKLNQGQTFKQMRLPKFYAKRILDTPYLYYKNPEFKNLEQLNTKYIKTKQDVQFKYSYGAKERVLVIGDSFGCNLFEFMPYSFNESLYLYNNPRGLIFEKYKPIIEEYKPDLLVLLFYTPNIPKFLDLYPNKYAKGAKSG